MLIEVTLWLILALTVSSLPSEDTNNVQALDEDPFATCCNGPPPPPCPPSCSE